MEIVQRYGGLNGPVCAYIWLLNSLIVALMEEEIRVWCCLTPLAPLAPALGVDQWGCLSGCRARGRGRWSEKGVGLQPDKNNGAEGLSQHDLARCTLTTTTAAFPSNNPSQPMAAEGEQMHMHTHTHTKSPGSQWGVGRIAVKGRGREKK